MISLTPKLFDFVLAYVEELASRDKLPTDLSPDEGLVIFAREFFVQYFSDVYGYNVVNFDVATAADVYVMANKQSDTGSVRPIVAAFREFCQDYEAIIGERYDRGGERSDFQRDFVPTLLEQIQEWAAEQNRDDLAEGAGSALNALEEVLAKVGDSK